MNNDENKCCQARDPESRDPLQTITEAVKTTADEFMNREKFHKSQRNKPNELCRNIVYTPIRWKALTLGNTSKPTSTHIVTTKYQQTCPYSSRRQGFFSSIIENIKEDIGKNKEMKENLKKFREEAEKLENSDALQAARKRFQAVESEASRGSEVFKEKFGGIKEKMQDAIDEAGKSEVLKKAGKFTEGISKSARELGENLSDTSQKLGSSSAFKTISQATEVVRSEMNTRGIEGRVYVSPISLRKRLETVSTDDKVIEPNAEATGVELHKDSKFYQQWQSFKDNNQYVNKVLDWKIKYEESENPVIRASRVLTEKVTDMFGGLFQKTELSETLTEICKIDPTFDAKKFLRDCENDIIPNILEAMVRADLEILKDWCYEGVFNIISTPLRQAKTMGYYLDSKILDIEHIELVMGKMMDQGPVLVITFQSQQIMCVRDSKNKVVEGDPEKVMRVHYVWVLCRDPQELNPKAAWRLLEMSANSTEQLV